MKSTKSFKKGFLILFTTLLFASSILFVVPQTNGLQCFAENTSDDEIYYCDDGFMGTGQVTELTESFEFAAKEVVADVYINASFPAYYNLNDSLTNACGAVAGANVIGFYDRYFEDLIPNSAPGYLRRNKYYYTAMTLNTSVKQGVINDLFTRMGTNVSSAGVTQTGYTNGLSSYVQSKGYASSYYSVMTNSALDIDKLCQAINAGDPVSIFLLGFNLCSFSEVNGTATIAKKIYTGNHIAIVYGYSTVNYYDSSYALVKVKTYLYVASGLVDTGYYLLNNNGSINNASAVHIS